jgi:hypothetical protein
LIEIPDKFKWKSKGKPDVEHMKLMIRMHTSLADATDEQLQEELDIRHNRLQETKDD